MITYNGEQCIEEQLDSILNQTVKPDEIIISDDGSSDKTLEIIRRIIEKHINEEIKIILLTDNPVHGIGPNYSWAVQHTKGNIIFSSGQDDVWAKDKIEKVLHVYNNYSDAKVVITDAFLIDNLGNKLNERFATHFINSLGVKQHEVIKVDRGKYIEYAESTPLIPGPVVSFTRSLLDVLFPFPSNAAEDQWIETIGLLEDSLYFLNERTTFYRIHSSTTHSVGDSIWLRIRKNLQRAKKTYTSAVSTYNYGNGLLKYYNTHPDKFDGRDAAIDTVNHIISIGEREISYMRMGRIKGAYNLNKMYRTDIRYKKTGRQAFILSLLYILMYSKKKRNQDIDIELTKSKT